MSDDGVFTERHECACAEPPLGRFILRLFSWHFRREDYEAQLAAS